MNKKLEGGLGQHQKRTPLTAGAGVGADVDVDACVGADAGVASVEECTARDGTEVVASIVCLERAVVVKDSLLRM
jgi:hypothetical protein